MTPSALKKWAASRRGVAARKRAGAMNDAQVVGVIQQEAEAAGATLAKEGKGGIDPRLALKVFRRDEYKCCIPKCSTAREDLELDHIGGHPLEIKEDPEADAFVKRAAQLGHKDSADNLHVICARHHDMVHQRERALEDGEQIRPSPRK